MTSQEEEYIPDAWMVRPCDIYHEEYKECRSLKGRFHQYFVYGEKQDCSQWLQDFQNCMTFRNHQSWEALEKLIESEKNRRSERVAKAKANDVWEYRTEPPADWDKPLPKELEKLRIPRLQQVQEKAWHNACTIL